MARSLTTSRLVLQPTGPEHAPGLHDAIDRSIDDLKPWMAWAAAHSAAQARSFAEAARQEWETGRGWGFAILLGGRVVGHVDLHGYRPLFNRAEIGYWISSEVAGRGLMSEAAAALVDFGFDEVGLHRIGLEAGVDNLGSIRVAEKLGFRREGMSRDASRGAFGYYDVYLYALLKTDPRPWRNDG